MPDLNGIESQRVGEVVESASHRFTAQCYRLYEAPQLGAFVRTDGLLGLGSGGDKTNIYSVVFGVSTQALDPGRPVYARGEDEDSEEAVYRSNPQLSRLLCTRFDALIVGHYDGSGYKQYLPAHPPRIHSFIYSCTLEELKGVTISLDFLSLLVSSTPGGRGITDEVIAACLRQAGERLGDPHSFLVRAGKVLAVQLAGDIPRLNSILKRLSP